MCDPSPTDRWVEVLLQSLSAGSGDNSTKALQCTYVGQLEDIPLPQRNLCDIAHVTLLSHNSRVLGRKQLLMSRFFLKGFPENPFFSQKDMGHGEAALCWKQKVDSVSSVEKTSLLYKKEKKNSWGKRDCGDFGGDFCEFVQVLANLGSENSERELQKDLTGLYKWHIPAKPYAGREPDKAQSWLNGQLTALRLKEDLSTSVPSGARLTVIAEQFSLANKESSRGQQANAA